MTLESLKNLPNFVKVKDYIVNLNNVCSIKFEEKKIIINMSYTTQTKAGFKPDFIFIEDYTNDDVVNIKENEVFKEKFIKVYNGNTDAYINIDSIGSFKYEPQNKRHIINFKAVHTYNFDNKQRVLAEFMYAYDCE